MSILRIFFAALVMFGGILATHAMSPSIAPPEHQFLRDFPSKIDVWHSKDLPYEPEVVKEIGADDYTNREYFGGGRSIELFIGYYKDQRSGDAIHSPKNCLPGSGWEYLYVLRAFKSGSPDKPVTVNEYIVQQGTEQDLVLYWYQTRERIVASEYWAKFWLVADGVRHLEYGRSHGTRLDNCRGRRSGTRRRVRRTLHAESIRKSPNSFRMDRCEDFRI